MTPTQATWQPPQAVVLHYVSLALAILVSYMVLPCSVLRVPSFLFVRACEAPPQFPQMLTPPQAVMLHYACLALVRLVSYVCLPFFDA